MSSTTTLLTTATYSMTSLLPHSESPEDFPAQKLHPSLPWPSELLPQPETQSQNQDYHASYLYLQLQLQMQILQNLSSSTSTSMSTSPPTPLPTGVGIKDIPRETKVENCTPISQYRAIAPRTRAETLQQDNFDKKKNVRFLAIAA